MPYQTRKYESAEEMLAAEEDPDPNLDDDPDFQREMFEMYVEDGVRPEDLREPDRTKFAQWLSAKEGGAEDADARDA